MNGRRNWVLVPLAVVMACCLPAGVAKGDTTIYLTQDKQLIDPDELVTVEAYLSAEETIYLWLYVVELEVSGGDSGSLDLDHVWINEGREDFVFYGHNVFAEGNDDPLFVFCFNQDEPYGVPVLGTKYLGSFRFQASSDAEGIFNVSIVPGDVWWGTRLLNSSVGLIPADLGDAAVIGVGVECTVHEHCDDYCDDGECVECLVNAHCNDDNTCTTDTCTDGVCSNTNKLLGSRCNDGLFCTATDECDGNGTCVGSGDACPEYDYCKECGGKQGCCWSPPVECSCSEPI